MIKIEVASARTCEEDEKKYVLYIVRVSKESEEQIDSEPSEFARRYTQFSDLYNNLKRDFPSPMSTVNFPKKVLLGNFDLKVIMSRTSGFVTFLEHIAKDVRLREAPCTINFFQQPELTKAKKLMEEKKYDQALSILEDNFKLLNKIYTDRSHVVLIVLCRLVACGSRLSDAASENSASLAGPTEKWASLALRRFDGVSDADLLALYAPLIQACINIFKTLGKDCRSLEDTLIDMRKRGMKVDPTVNLMDAIFKYEESQEV